MKGAGVPIETDLIATGFNSFACGIEAGKKLLGLDKRPTAIFAANDEMAAGVLTIAHAHQLSVPRDLSLVGFDDIPLATQLWPTRATEMLLEILSGQTPHDAPRIESIASKLMHRQSTAAPLAAA
jgi:LacI family transcriptional regulator